MKYLKLKVPDCGLDIVMNPLDLNDRLGNLIELCLNLKEFILYL